MITLLFRALRLHGLDDCPVCNGDDNAEKDQANERDQHAHDPAQDRCRRDVAIADGEARNQCEVQSLPVVHSFSNRDESRSHCDEGEKRGQYVANHHQDAEEVTNENDELFHGPTIDAHPENWCFQR